MQITNNQTSSYSYNTDSSSTSQKNSSNTSNSFESLISFSTEKSSSKNEEKEVIVQKSTTQSLYEDIISLLKTGFTVGELKAFEERLKEILKMIEDKNSGKDISQEDIESALKKLEMEILEAKKSINGQVIKKASDSATPSDNTSSDFDLTIDNISNMLQEIKNSSKNTNVNDDSEIKNEAYDKLKLLLKMS